jgi:hypothetical protein
MEEALDDSTEPAGLANIFQTYWPLKKEQYLKTK